jgi:hypothetical protein
MRIYELIGHFLLLKSIEKERFEMCVYTRGWEYALEKYFREIWFEFDWCKFGLGLRLNY